MPLTKNWMFAVTDHTTKHRCGDNIANTLQCIYPNIVKFQLTETRFTLI